jgi:streptogramin lyase
MKVVASVDVGDGVSDIVPDGDTLLLICHRDHTLWRLDPAANTAKRLSVLPGDTPERLALAGGSLWATGRGTDLLRIDPRTGKTLETIETGVGGIELAAIDGTIWVAAAEAGADRQGLPELERLVAVDAEGGEPGEQVTPTELVTVTGMATDGTALWIADVVAGALTRVR